MTSGWQNVSNSDIFIYLVHLKSDQALQNLLRFLILFYYFQCGGVYVFSNYMGGDGERVFYDGGSSIACNGSIVSQGPQFTLKDVVMLPIIVSSQAVWH